MIQLTHPEYFSLFGTSPEEIGKVLSAALSKGGDYADIFFEMTESNELSLRDGEVNAVRSDIDYGAGIRVIAGEKSGYAFSENTSPESLVRAALTASKIASSARPGSISSEQLAVRSTNRYPVISPWKEHSVDQKKSYLTLLKESIHSKSSNVVNVIGRLSDVTTKVLFWNSLGECYTDLRPMASMSAVAIMVKGSRMENFYSTRSFREGFEFLTPERVEDLAQECVDGCSRLFEAGRPTGGEMPVVMGAGSSGILLHEAIGHTFEADFNRKGISIFSEKMGQKICNEEINIVDDGTLSGNRGSVNVDDEGVPGEKTYMVKNGILSSYLHDRISAKYYGVPPTGNGRRESFRYMPIPRMRATYMENGTSKEEDLIASVKHGIYVDNFSNGQVQIGAGDFTFYVKSGFMIENGHLTRPIKDVNIIGNGPEALAAIEAVANNSIIDNSTWTCGKGQICPVSCGMPSVLVRRLNVGGTNE